MDKFAIYVLCGLPTENTNLTESSISLYPKLPRLPLRLETRTNAAPTERINIAFIVARKTTVFADPRNGYDGLIHLATEIDMLDPHPLTNG